MSHLNLKNKRASKTAIGIAMCAFSAALVSGVGLSAWVIAGGVSGGSANFSAGAGVVTEKDFGYLYPNSVTKTENLEYCDNGFVYQDDIGTVGHLIFHLIFEPGKYLTALNKSASTSYFSFSLSYKTYQSSFVLIDTYASCAAHVWDRNNAVNVADGTSMALSKTNHIATCSTSAYPMNLSSSSVVYYVTLDYKFDAGSNFSSIKTNELANSPSFLLTAGVTNS
jgi:hypothetical protein